jgi:transposase InsO family protein
VRVGYDRKVIINITNTHTLSVAEIEEFVRAPKPIKFSAINKKEAYDWIEKTLVNVLYWRLDKHHRGTVKKYLKIMTGYSKVQVARLIAKWRKSGHIRKNLYHRTVFPTIYQRSDVVLLAETDKLFEVLSGPATKNILSREYHFFGKTEYQRLSKISVSHIYNLRDHFVYRNILRHFNHTRARNIPIGERRKPCPNGKPGCIRVDSVHQGDDPSLGKSVYHINFVDEVLQWEVVACVERISEHYLKPVLEEMLGLFPFVIFEFHSDNGGEFINRLVAEMLNRLKIQLTKSRSRHTTDNALVETKNGSVIRKEMGYHFIQKGAAGIINNWYQRHFNIYLNYHRPCGYATIITNHKGKQKKVYRSNGYMTPYEKFKSLKNAEQYLKPEITFAMLDKIAYNQSDVEFAIEVRKAKQKMAIDIKNLRSLEENIRQNH